jgi:hypothetical protein
MSWRVGPLHRCSVGGIPTVWAESPGRFEAGLVFRVGRCDEPFPRRGITHLVEHLVHPPHPTPGYDFNGWVSSASTVFWAAGREARVVEHLEAICRSLADLPVDDLERERAVLLTEESQHGGSAVGTALGLRFGTLGHGASGFREVGLRWLPGDLAAAWARERFTLGNAALFMTGPPPDGLVLALPPGDPLPAPEPAGLEGVRYPCAHDDGPSELASLSLVGRHCDELTVGLAVAEHRAIRRLRHELGLSYSIDTVQTTLTRDLEHVLIGADCAEGAEGAAAKELVAVVRELAADGPTDAEVAAATEELDRWTHEPERLSGELIERATEAVLGRAHREPLTSAVSPDGVAGALRSAVDASGLLVLPEGADVPEGFVPYLPTLARPELGDDARTFRLRRWSSQRVRELVIGGDGIEMTGDGGILAATLRFADCVAALHGGDGGRMLVGHDGRVLLLEPDAWYDGGEAVDAVDAAIPADRHVPLGPTGAGLAIPRPARRSPPRLVEAPEEERARFSVPFGIERDERGVPKAVVRWMGAIFGSRSPLAEGESRFLKVTDRRVLVATVMTRRVITSIPLEGIQDVTVSRHPAMVRSVVTIRSGDRDEPFFLDPADAARFAEAVRAAMAASDGGPEAGPEDP